MAGQQDYLLRFKLEAETKDLQNKLRSVEKQLNQFTSNTSVGAKDIQKNFKGVASEISNVVSIFTGDKLSGATSQITSFGNALSAIPGPAGLAVGAVAGLGAVTAGVGVALFGLTKSASDFGSTIHDASIQTGLGAETISALKLAADQSGTSLEQMTGAVSKFAKNVGAAGEDAKTAAAFVKAFGITPLAALNDLDGSLAKVFTRIGEAKPGVEQITLAQKAFGKSGADLIPLMEQTGFSLVEFKKHATDLAATITDKDAAAADAFGDQMVELEAQIAGVGRTIGFELMPVFRDMATFTSNWLHDNKGEISSWGTFTANVLRGVAGYWNDITGAVRRFKAESRAGGQSPFAGPDASAGGVAASMIPPVGLAMQLGKLLAGRGAQDVGTEYGPFSWEMSKPKTDFGTSVGGKSSGKSAKDKIKETIAEITKAMGNPQVLAFFSALSTIEGGGINTVVGGARSSVTDPRHPGAYGMGAHGPAGRSTAAGLFQETFTNWKANASQLDLTDFRDPKQQLKLALFLFQQASGGKGIGQIMSGDFAGAAKSGTQPWAASPFSTLPGRKRKDFLSLIQQNLASGKFGEIAEDPKKRADEEIKIAEDAAKRRVEIGQTMTESLIDLAGHEYEKSLEYNDPDAAIAAAQQVHDLKIQLIDDEIAALDDRYQRAAAGSSEEAEAFHALSIAKIKQVAAERTADDALAKNKDEILARQLAELKLIADVRDRELEVQSALNAADEDDLIILAKTIGAKAKAAKDAADAAHQSMLEHTVGSGQEIGAIDQLHAHFAGEGNTAAIAGIDATAQALNGMGEALGQVVDAWVLYGSAGQSAQQVTAQILAGIAQQATVKAVFELAEGFAALAMSFFGIPNAGPSAAAHFTAAAIYGGIAVGAAVTGRGVAGDSFKQGAGGGGGNAGGGGRSGSGNGGGNQVNQNPTPYSRASENAYLSGQMPYQQALHRLADSVDKLHHKIDTARPGDVLARAVKEKPGLIGNQAVTDIKRNSGTGRALARSIGIK